MNTASWRAIMLVLSFVAGILLNFRFEIEPIVPDGDNSRAWANAYAAAEGWRFGEDVVFSHGPLAFLILEKLDVGSHVVVTLVFSLSVSLLAGWTAYRLGETLRGRGRALAVVSAIAAHVAVAFPGALAEYQLLNLALLLLVVSILNAGARAPLVAAAVLCGFFPAMKASLGTSAFLLLLCASVFAGGRLGLMRRICATLGAFFASVILVWIACGQAPADLPAFLDWSVEVMKSYPHILGSNAKGWPYLVAHYVAFLAVIAVWTSLLRRAEAYRILICFLFPMLMTLKHSVTRMDYGHMMNFAHVGLLLVAVLSMLSWVAGRRMVAAVCALLCVLLLEAAPFLTEFRNDVPTFRRGIPQLLVRAPRLTAQSFSRAFRIEDERRRVRILSEEALSDMRLPENLRMRIGDASVDVWSPDISYIPANGFRYRPRPTLTSLLSASVRLDGLNARFLRSEKAPDFILCDQLTYGLGFIHLSWEEPATYFTILERYELDAQHESVVIFRKRDAALDVVVNFVGDSEVRWGEEFRVPQPAAGGVITAGLNVPLPVWTKLLFFAFKPDVFNMHVREASGDTMRVRFLLPTAEGPLLMNPLPRNDTESVQFFQGELRPFERVAWLKPGNIPASFLPPVRIRWEERVFRSRLP